jgi:hypothetical protein
MQDRAYGLRRIHLPRTRANKGKKRVGRSCYYSPTSPRPRPLASGSEYYPNENTR